MIAFDEQEAAAERERKLKEGVADEDGFVTVSYKNTHKRQRGVAEEDTSKKRKRNKKPAKELKNFYRFQVREEKRERLADLRKKFEEDKARIARMKAQRKFKPF
jgi:ribosomal RNA-processing protein 7